MLDGAIVLIAGPPFGIVVVPVFVATGGTFGGTSSWHLFCLVVLTSVAIGILVALGFSLVGGV